MTPSMGRETKCPLVFLPMPSGISTNALVCFYQCMPSTNSSAMKGFIPATHPTNSVAWEIPPLIPICHPFLQYVHEGPPALLRTVESGPWEDLLLYSVRCGTRPHSIWYYLVLYSGLPSAHVTHYHRSPTDEQGIDRSNPSLQDTENQYSKLLTVVGPPSPHTGPQCLA
jgi:hypothetical protein